MNELLELKEKRQHGSFLFHFAVYEISSNFPDILPHWHNELEILVGIENETDVRIGEEDYKIQKNEILIVPCNAIHSSNSYNKKYLCYAVLFDSAMLGSNLIDSCRMNYIDPIINHTVDYNLHITADTQWGKNIISRMNRIIELNSEKSFAFELGIKSSLYDVFYELSSNLPQNRKIETLKNPEVEKLKHSLIFIEKNYMNKITIDEMAGQSFMSVYYFCRYFKKVLGMTPFNFLNQYRIQMGAKLLKETDLPITSIAFDVGFNDSSYFSKMFQKYMNCTPTDFKISS
ncbi:MAG: helix-turn-helix domain-containing protein [Spirochaetes bacterium]|nr:helix-turn-helix domain-containing protein [Spirochaetota bacterium]